MTLLFFLIFLFSSCLKWFLHTASTYYYKFIILFTESTNIGFVSFEDVITNLKKNGRIPQRKKKSLANKNNLQFIDNFKISYQNIDIEYAI